MKRFIAWRQAVINRLIHRPWIVAVRNAPAEPTMQSLYFSNGEQGVLLDASDMTTMFQDAAGTTPVTAAGQPVGLWLDTSGNGNHFTQPTAGKRPQLQTDGTHWWLQGDGIDDFMSSAAIDFAATDKMTVWSGVRKLSDAALLFICETGSDSGVTPGTFRLTAPSGAAEAAFGFAVRGSAVETGLRAFTYASPISCVLVGGFDLAATTRLTAVIPRVNGAAPGSVTGIGSDAQPGGSFANQPIYLFSRAGTSFFNNGYLSSLIVRGAATSEADLIPGEEWTAERIGVTLP